MKMSNESNIEIRSFDLYFNDSSEFRRIDDAVDIAIEWEVSLEYIDIDRHKMPIERDFCIFMRRQVMSHYWES